MQTTYNGLELPKDGQPIAYKDGQFEVPDHPIVPFIEGDGTGRDIWKASQRVFDAAVEKAYGGRRAIRWYEIFAGEKEFGIGGFLAAIRQNISSPTPQLLDRVLQSARAFGDAEEFEDDVCLLAVDISGQAKR